MQHSIELTKRGERYAANINAMSPSGCPAGVDPVDWRAALESRVEQHLAIVTGLLALLDDGLDPDLEPWLAGFDDGPRDDRETGDGDDEFSLGWTLAFKQEGNKWLAPQWGDGDREVEHDGREPDEDREAVNEDGGDVLDVPHDGQWHPCLDTVTIPGGNEWPEEPGAQL